MEAKVSARSSKKSAGGSGTSSDRKKSRKKKKDKRKQSLQLLRGTESKDSDAVSPDCDSEVQAEGDNTQTDHGDGPSSTTLVGQVTRLPHLGSQTSVSLITQGVGASYSSPFAAQATTTTTTTTTASRVTSTVISTTTEDVIRVTPPTAAVKRSSKSRAKAGQSSKSGNAKSSRNKNRQGVGGGRGAGASTTTATTTSTTTPSASNAGGKVVTSVSSESLRWEMVLEDTEKERERIAVYKMNRRKRYLKAAQAKGLGWAVNYTTAAISPLSEDSGVDAGSNFVDFGAMQALRPLGAHRGLAEAFVEC